MRTSDKLFIGCLVPGAAAGGWLWYETGWVWVPIAIALLITGGLYKAFLDMLSKESIIDSDVINRKKR